MTLLLPAYEQCVIVPWIAASPDAIDLRMATLPVLLLLLRPRLQSELQSAHTLSVPA
jgi:hypothetical protein